MISVIIRCRDEYPILLGTLHAFIEELEFHGHEYEIIIVDNLSKDPTPHVLRDRYRRLVNKKLLIVEEYTEKHSTWCAINHGYGRSSGDVIVVSDAHINMRTGTLDLLIKGVREHGGIWHAPMHLWGDTDSIKNYGMDLRLGERFWGNPCPHVPPGESTDKPWPIAMSGASLYAVSREEIEKFGFYSPLFKAYGGGEPYLAMKWWMGGSKVWMEPRGLHRHAFGLNACWKKGPKKARNSVLLKDGSFTKEIPKGVEFLSYSAGYSVPNDEFYFNFMLAATEGRHREACRGDCPGRYAGVWGHEARVPVERPAP
jgi:glycosyltransferase involved in cell wall biosynthesis